MKLAVLKISFLLLLVSLSSCRMWGVRGNGNLTDENRDISEFDKIEVGGAFTVNIKVGESPSLKISAEDNLIDYIRTRVHGDKLVIDTRKSISPRKEIKIDITTPSLKDVDASGASNIHVWNIDSDEFNVNVSGAGSLDLSGNAEDVYIDMSGAGSLDAKNLKTKSVEIDISGAANADVYASERLKATVSGVGNIDFYGDPKDVKSSVSGVGSINRK